MNMNHYYFTGLKCEECGTSESLYKNKYSDNVLCITCLNNLAREVETKEKEYKVDVIINEMEG